MLHPRGPNLAIDKLAVPIDSVLQKAVSLRDQLPKVHRSKHEIFKLGKRVVEKFVSLNREPDVRLIPTAVLDLRLNLYEVGQDV